jgi:hypothetical protein
MSKCAALKRHYSEREQKRAIFDGRCQMQYTLMFYLSPDEFSSRSDPTQREAFWGAFLPYMRAVKEAGSTDRVPGALSIWGTRSSSR